jgi:hypothetical protein
METIDPVTPIMSALVSIPIPIPIPTPTMTTGEAKAHSCIIGCAPEHKEDWDAKIAQYPHIFGRK